MSKKGFDYCSLDFDRRQRKVNDTYTEICEAQLDGEDMNTFHAAMSLTKQGLKVEPKKLF